MKPGSISSDTPITSSNSNINSNGKSSSNRKQNSNVATGFTLNLTTENILHCNIATTINSKIQHGPLVDDGAPFSAIGETELLLLQNKSDKSNIQLDAKPTELKKPNIGNMAAVLMQVISVKVLDLKFFMSRRIIIIEYLFDI